MAMEENVTKNRWHFFWELIEFIIIVLAIIVPIRLFVAQPFIVNGASMEPTFQNGNYLIVDEISYQFKDPQVGEVIVFRYPLNPSQFFIKRVIGTPNQTIEVEGKTIKLGDEEYYVLGDNRGASSDSRVWGTVAEKLITGRALLRLWPIDEFGLFPGKNESLEINFKPLK